MTHYADDTSSRCRGKNEEKVIKKLEEDVKDTLLYGLEWVSGKTLKDRVHDAR